MQKRREKLKKQGLVRQRRGLPSWSAWRGKGERLNQSRIHAPAETGASLFSMAASHLLSIGLPSALLPAAAPAQSSTTPPETPSQTDLPTDPPLNPALPTVFIVGDSTARNDGDLGGSKSRGSLKRIGENTEDVPRQPAPMPATTRPSTPSAGSSAT